MPAGEPLWNVKQKHMVKWFYLHFLSKEICRQCVCTQPFNSERNATLTTEKQPCGCVALHLVQIQGYFYCRSGWYSPFATRHLCYYIKSSSTLALSYIFVLEMKWIHSSATSYASVCRVVSFPVMHIYFLFQSYKDYIKTVLTRVIFYIKT